MNEAFGIKLKYHIFQLTWSVLYIGLSLFTLLATARFEAFSGKEREFGTPEIMFLSMTLLYLVMTAAHILIGRKRIKEWGRNDLILSIVLMVLSFPLAVTLLRFSVGAA